MAGIFGFYAFGEGREQWASAKFIYYALSALQGRGQEAASIVTYDRDGEGFGHLFGEGSVEEVFGKSEKEARGFLGIGQVSTNKQDMAIIVDEPLRLALVGDGKPILHEDEQEAYRNFAEELSKRLVKGKDLLEATLRLMDEVKGGYSFIALTEDQKMICGRDPLGIKPLEVGAVGFDIGAVASEGSALDVIGAEHSGYIKPGEVVVFDPLSIARRCMNNAGMAYCSFEYVYLARPDSSLNSIPVYRVRERIGKKLAEEFPAKADVVVGVPDTALPFAMAYSECSKIPTKLGFSRTGRPVRTAIKPTQFERIVGVQLKLNPIRETVDGKDIILIDDSVVRGNTLRNTVYSLKRRGAKRVHVRVGSPPLVARCPFGTEVPEEDELIGKALSNEEIAEIVGADTFAYLTVDGLIEAIGLPGGRLCLGCFTGKYPEGSL